MSNQVTRPLKTGRSFVVAIRQMKVHQLRFDKADYAPGDACELSMLGFNLGNKPIELIVEEEQESSAWKEVARVQAEVDGGTTAKASWTFPVPPGHAANVAAARGSLESVNWSDQQVEPGAINFAQAEVEGFEGDDLVFLVEQEQPDGSWRVVSHGQGTVRDGKTEIPFQTPKLPPKPAGTLKSAVFEDGTDLGDAKTAWVRVEAEGLESQPVQIVLERLRDDGIWEEVSSAVSTVKSNAARTGISLGH